MEREVCHAWACPAARVATGTGKVRGVGALPEEGRHVLAERVAQETPHVGQILSSHVWVVRRGPAVRQPSYRAAQRAQRHHSLVRREEDAKASLQLHPLQLLSAKQLGQLRLRAAGAQKLGAEQLDGTRAESGNEFAVELCQQWDAPVVGGGERSQLAHTATHVKQGVARTPTRYQRAQRATSVWLARVARGPMV